MPCFHPLDAWYSKEINESGKRSLVFKRESALEPDNPKKINCGQCIGCRLEHSRQWAVRCVHEASLYENNMFITLTFDDEHLAKRDFPESLDVRDFQLFMKRYRFECGPGIRFFHCGEYGDKNGRPHYHAIIFNHDFDDKKLHKIDNGHRTYTSEKLQKLWPYGFALIGDVTFESAAYVARYITKKITGEAALEHYAVGYDPETGEIITKKPEYTTMSRRPGIGAKWFEKYKEDVYPNDFVVINGKKIKPPKYYDGLLEKLDLDESSLLKDNRMLSAFEFQENSTYERLETRERLQKLRLNRLPRKIG